MLPRRPRGPSSLAPPGNIPWRRAGTASPHLVAGRPADRLRRGVGPGGGAPCGAGAGGETSRRDGAAPAAGALQAAQGQRALGRSGGSVPRSEVQPRPPRWPAGGWGGRRGSERQHPLGNLPASAATAVSCATPRRCPAAVPAGPGQSREAGARGGADLLCPCPGPAGACPGCGVGSSCVYPASGNAGAAVQDETCPVAQVGGGTRKTGEINKC